MALDTRELFARLIQCEAGGEGEFGMAAVACLLHTSYSAYPARSTAGLRLFRMTRFPRALESSLLLTAAPLCQAAATQISLGQKTRTFSLL